MSFKISDRVNSEESKNRKLIEDGSPCWPFLTTLVLCKIKGDDWSSMEKQANMMMDLLYTRGLIGEPISCIIDAFSSKGDDNKDLLNIYVAVGKVHRLAK